MSRASANETRLAILKDRAHMLGKARAFFADRKIMEVDVPILSRYASIDAHIDLVQAICMGKRCFLHFSPEYGMKRLLAQQAGDIFQLSHVFRDEESGERHLPEFTMAEWYRQGFSLEQLIHETIAFIELFLGRQSAVEMLSYREALERYASHIPDDPEERHLVFGLEVEPKLGFKGISVIHAFPSSQAFMAKTYVDRDEELASRFEVFYQGMELANGYQELTDPLKQKLRFEDSNQQRIALKKEAYPIDFPFLEALEQGIPDCCGVAVGFDRLMMLRHGVSDIRSVVPFALEEAP